MHPQDMLSMKFFHENITRVKVEKKVFENNNEHHSGVRLLHALDKNYY